MSQSEERKTVSVGCSSILITIENTCKMHENWHWCFAWLKKYIINSIYLLSMYYMKLNWHLLVYKILEIQRKKKKGIATYHIYIYREKHSWSVSQKLHRKRMTKTYMSKKVCSLASKLSSVICSQNSCSSALVMEDDVIPLRRANASNNSLANSLDSFIPNHNHTKFHQLLG